MVDWALKVNYGSILLYCNSYQYHQKAVTNSLIEQTDRQTERQRQRETETEADRDTDRQTDRQRHRQTET